MGCYPNCFSKAWWTSGWRWLPAGIFFFIGAVCLFGSPFFVPLLVGVALNSSTFKTYSCVSWPVGVAGNIIIVLTFLVLHGRALNRKLYIKYCLTSIMMYTFYSFALAGTVFIYSAAFSFLAEFNYAIVFTAVESLPILIHLCSYATLEPFWCFLSALSLVGFTAKVYGLWITGLGSAICAIFSFKPKVTTIILLVTRILTLCVTAFSCKASVPPLKQLVSVHVAYPAEDADAGTVFSDETELGVRVRPMKQEPVDYPLPEKEPKTIRIVQLTDIHLGTLTTPEHIRNFCAEIVRDIKPDLVLLTGDMLTTPFLDVANTAICSALEPLKKMPGRVFGCLGNHDLESELLVREALDESGVKMLIDEAVEVQIEGCDRPVQIIGCYYRKPVAENAGCYRSLLENNPPSSPDALRLVLLHDPTSFKYVPVNARCFVLSGHTHGGIVGVPGHGSMLSLAGYADHGLWKRGRNYNYIHCGQGSRFMLGTNVAHLGITCEKSVLTLHY